MAAVYAIAQLDVTAAVLAEQRLTALQEEQEALLKQILPQQASALLLSPWFLQALLFVCGGVCGWETCQHDIVSGADRHAAPQQIMPWA